MRNIAKLPSPDRQDLFTNTADEMGLTTAIVEKDFWVCWTLDYLFHRCKWSNSIAFKGGTSLSKAYNLIERFSEDIDIILDWRVLGYGKNVPLEIRSKTGQDKLNKEINAKTVEFLCNEFVPSILSDVSSELGVDVEIKTDDIDNQTVLFKYPQMNTDRSILQDIRLEIGALAAWTPAASATITPYSAEKYSRLFTNPSTNVLTVTPERTFWEKATILHHEANRPGNLIMPKRYSRHYYDIYILSKSWVKEKAFSDISLLNRVIEFKQRFYSRAWAQYDKAVPGTVKLMPPNHCVDTLKEDYAQMRSMIFGNRPDFNELLEGIRDLEREINSLQNDDTIYRISVDSAANNC